jgi:hypothetical protein
VPQAYEPFIEIIRKDVAFPAYFFQLETVTLRRQIHTSDFWLFVGWRCAENDRRSQ